MKSSGRKIPSSLKLRVHFYNLRRFCDPSFVLDESSFDKFYGMFEKLVKDFACIKIVL